MKPVTWDSGFYAKIAENLARQATGDKRGQEIFWQWYRMSYPLSDYTGIETDQDATKVQLNENQYKFITANQQPVPWNGNQSQQREGGKQVDPKRINRTKKKENPEYNTNRHQNAHVGGFHPKNKHEIMKK